MKENVIILKTSENSSIKSTGEMFFLQLLLGRHCESAQVHAGSSTPQKATEPVISRHTLFITTNPSECSVLRSAVVLAVIQFVVSPLSYIPKNT